MKKLVGIAKSVQHHKLANRIVQGASFFYNHHVEFEICDKKFLFSSFKLAPINSNDEMIVYFSERNGVSLVHAYKNKSNGSIGESGLALCFINGVLLTGVASLFMAHYSGSFSEIVVSSISYFCGLFLLFQCAKISYVYLKLRKM